MLLEIAYHVEGGKCGISMSQLNVNDNVVGHDSDSARLSSYNSYIKDYPNAKIRPDIRDGINQEVGNAAKKGS